MEVERGHRGGSELFVCFTSRQSSSSSSMKLSSKSILSPGRTDKFRETSVCRRLKSNGSIKGQSSPMFPTGRKKSSSFETQEPSSPKVTCIGQVRVKTKQGKRRKAMASRSGEVSFRGNGSKREQHECLPNRNQRWGHLFGFRKEISLSICEAIREFNCFLPCGGGGGGSGGGSSGKDSGTAGKERKETSSACGAVFARWLMVLQESDEKRLQEEEMEEGQCLVDQTAIAEEQREKKGGDAEGEIEEETIAVPPRNALLLMRCRSEPFRVSSLANRFWDSPAPKEEHEDDDEDEEDEDEDDDDAEVEDAYEEAADVEQGEDHKEHKLITDQGVTVLELVEEHPILQEEEEEEEKHEEEAKEEEEGKEEVGLEQVSSEELLEKEPVSETHFSEIVEDEKEEKTEHSDGYSGTRETLALEDSTESSGFMQTPEEESTENGGYVQTREEDDSARNGRDLQTGEEDSVENGGYVQTGEVEDSTTNGGYVQTQEAMALEEEDEEEDSIENAGYERAQEAVALEEEEAESEREEEEGEYSTEKNEMEERITTETSEAGPVLADSEEKPTQQEEESRPEKQEEEEQQQLEEEQEQQEQEEQKEEERCPNALPDCLLLMMCEPKLSMEVSKETWVCSTDFLRRRPVKAEGAKGCEESKQRVSTEEQAALAVAEAPVAAPTPPPPPPPPVSMAKMIEQKLVHAYEPFVLTRCKSEPLRSSDKLAPEACFWKSRKLERPTVGVGAAGMGF